jgi:hypothetical protein
MSPQLLHAHSNLSQLRLMMSSNVSEHVALVFGLLWTVWTLELWIFATFKPNVSEKCPFHSVSLETIWTAVPLKTWHCFVCLPLKVWHMYTAEELLSHFSRYCDCFLLLFPQMVQSCNKDYSLVIPLQHQLKCDWQISSESLYNTMICVCVCGGGGGE